MRAVFGALRKVLAAGFAYAARTAAMREGMTYNDAPRGQQPARAHKRDLSPVMGGRERYCQG
jgi:hypothetical protein